MKLEPIAKPIRIRIKLGNSEYSSLDSVKSNFSIKELYPLFKDGRLERWLMQIGEVQLAHNTGDLSKKCGNGDIQDYIQFLSLFFDEVADSLSAYKDEEEWSLNDYLSSIPLDTVKIIYTKTEEIEDIDWSGNIDNILSKENVFSIFEDPQLQTVYDIADWGIKLSGMVESEDDYKSIFRFIEAEARKHSEYENVLLDYYYATYNSGYNWASIFGNEDLNSILEWYSNAYFVKNCKQDWQSIIRPHLTVDNIKTIFESERYSEIYKGYWGEEFAKLVTDEEKYKDLLTYLERFSRNNPQHERCRNIISTFYSDCSKKGYKWPSAFKEDLSLDYITYFYQNECFQILSIDWGMLFADCVKDWSTDCEKIEEIIKHNAHDTISFYNHCVENGIEEAKMKLDPWYILANSEDYEYVIKAIDEWDGIRSHYSRDNYNYYYLNSALGKQILDFMQSLIDLRGKNGFWGDDRYYGCEYYLEDEKQVMIYVSKRYINSGWLTFNISTKNELIAMRKRGVTLAGYALDNTQGYNAEKSYLEIAKYAISQFGKALRKRRM